VLWLAAIARSVVVMIIVTEDRGSEGTFELSSDEEKELQRALTEAEADEREGALISAEAFFAQSALMR
jgi:hypothetical protein